MLSGERLEAEHGRAIGEYLTLMYEYPMKLPSNDALGKYFERNLDQVLFTNDTQAVNAVR